MKIMYVHSRPFVVKKRMNYRHVYHAGNFADVIKHLVLALCIDRLKEKEAPFFVLDAHGGCGVYDLTSEEAGKTGEYEDGIAKLLAAPPQDKDVRLYLSSVQADWKKKRYPGSPVLIARMLRPQDRLIANELHPEDYKILRRNLAGFKNSRTFCIDAYQAIRANLPPQERRGMVLVDPPFEKTDEFGALIVQMREWKKRWETGTYLIWYPVKPHLPVGEFYAAAAGAGFKNAWICEYESGAAFDPEKPNKLLKTGVMLLNAPYQVPERAEAALGEIAGILGGSCDARFLGARG